MVNYKFISTTETEWFQIWDKIQEESIYGSFFQYSSWINSYKEYGFETELLLMFDDNSNILGGMACQYIDFFFGKLYFCNCGPIITISDPNRKLENSMLHFFYNRAIEIGAIASVFNKYFDISLKNEIKDPLNKIFRKGTLLTKVYFPKHFNLIYLKDKSLDEILISFKANGRRDVRASLRKNLIFKFAETEREIENAYACFQANADREGYFIRSWVSQKEMIFVLFKLKRTFFPMAYCDDKLIGAIWIGKGAKMMHYLMGGIERRSPDLLTGYFLQWQAINFSFELGCDYYNISVGGSDGVKSFKSRFNPEYVSGPGSFYVVNSHWKLFIFNIFRKIAEGNKSKAIKILNFINRVKNKF